MGYTIGLMVFILVVLADAAALLLDYWLERNYWLTISDLVRINPMLGVALVAVQLAAPLGLALHFWGTR